MYRTAVVAMVVLLGACGRDPLGVDGSDAAPPEDLHVGDPDAGAVDAAPADLPPSRDGFRPRDLAGVTRDFAGSSRDLARVPRDLASGTDGGASTGLVPLTELVNGSYHGFPGGLYPGGNDPPAGHLMAGIVQGNAVQPLDGNGDPDPNGRYVLLSIGMSNTTQEFCANASTQTLCPCACDAWSFTGQALADNAVEKTQLVIVNGAAGGQTAGTWDAPNDPNYDLVRDNRLRPAGLTERQVQVAWVKVANAGPRASLPAMNADAHQLVTQMGDIVRALRSRYPNLRQVFLSSRIYAGWATTTLNPEPYAFESGLAVKWLVQAQIDQTNSGQIVDARAGDLDLASGAPWVAWGPYLWADGLTPRADGLTWPRADFVQDGTHPSTSGRAKVGAELLRFFRDSPATRCWFTTTGTCP